MCCPGVGGRQRLHLSNPWRQHATNLLGSLRRLGFHYTFAAVRPASHGSMPYRNSFVVSLPLIIALLAPACCDGLPRESSLLIPGYPRLPGLCVIVSLPLMVCKLLHTTAVTCLVALCVIVCVQYSSRVLSAVAHGLQDHCSRCLHDPSWTVWRSQHAQVQVGLLCHGLLL